MPEPIRPHPSAILSGPHVKELADIGEAAPVLIVTPLQIVPHESWPFKWLRPSK